MIVGYYRKIYVFELFLLFIVVNLKGIIVKYWICIISSEKI